MASDDWPFLYLREPMLPALNIRSMLMMGVLAALLIVICLTLAPAATSVRVRPARGSMRRCSSWARASC